MKAILEFEAPRGCLHCPLREVDKYGHTTCCITGHQGHNYDRPTHCPLRFEDD